MASNNNDTRKKQKKTAVDGDSPSQSSTSGTFIVFPPALSFGTIVHHFPELLMYLLPYIADRTVFNSMASCNRDTHEKSKAIVPPWPTYYRLLDSNKYSLVVWSPDGTRVAYTCHYNQKKKHLHCWPTTRYYSPYSQQWYGLL